MVISDSLELYKKACQDAEYYFQSGQRYNEYSQNNRNVSGYAINRGYNAIFDLGSYYMQIISTMIYELMVKKSSSLLSMLCSKNRIWVETVNFTISYDKYGSGSAYDILPIIDGLNTAFTKSLEECNFLFEKYQKDIFQNKVFKEGYDYVSAITTSLKELDKNIGRLFVTPIESVEKSKQKVVLQNPNKDEISDKILRIHDPKLTDKLNQFAENRRANDLALSEQIQQLQLTLQDELKEIIAIREDIDYNTTQEAINQFISLFMLVSETLQYHPNDFSMDSYNNLIESCEDFLENIKQSLAMLGVTIINDSGKPFDPEKHKAIRGFQPTRMSIIKKVVKIGFAYKNKVIEKAEVELI